MRPREASLVAGGKIYTSSTEELLLVYMARLEQKGCCQQYLEAATSVPACKLCAGKQL